MRQSKDYQYPDQDGSQAGGDAHMAHLPTGIGVIVKRADLDAQDQVENSAEGDEDAACGGNFPGYVIFHIFYLTIQPRNKPPGFLHVVPVFIPELLEHNLFFFLDPNQGARDDHNQVRKTGDPVVQHQHLSNAR